jgi:hypothetical protein
MMHRVRRLRRSVIALPAVVAAVIGCQLAFPTRGASESGLPEAGLDTETGVPFGDAQTGDAGGLPNANNTGVPPGTSLTPSGSLELATAHEVVEGREIDGSVHVAANDVTLRRCKVKGNDTVLIRIEPNVTGCLIEDCEIYGNGGQEIIAVLGPATIVRSNIHTVEVAFTFGGSATIKDSFIWGLANGKSYHGVKIDGDAHDVNVLHNNITSRDPTAAVMIDNLFGAVTNVMVDGNRLVGGTFTLYSDASQSSALIRGVTISNNRFGRGAGGYVAINKNDVVQFGNVDDATGAALEF